MTYHLRRPIIYKISLNSTGLIATMNQSTKMHTSTDKATKEQQNSEIKLEVVLDSAKVPEKIYWSATEGSSGSKEETKAIGVSVWDHHQKNTLRIDLWTKDMPVDELKKFYIDAIGGLAQSLLSATGDEYMAQEINALCNRLVEYIKNKMISD